MYVRTYVSVCLSPCLSVRPGLSCPVLPVFSCVFLILAVSSIPVSVCVCLCLPVQVCVCLCLRLSVSVSASLSLSVSVWLAGQMAGWLSVCLSVCLSAYARHTRTSHTCSMRGRMVVVLGMYIPKVLV